MSAKQFLFCFLGLALILMTNQCTEKEPENTPPIARFTVSSNTGTIETLFTFDASASSDLEDLPADLKVRWDWESDGRWDTDFSSEKTINKGFNPKGF